eukprot:SAG22_NODE_1528_length_4218_cov_30.416363_4_plen_82_part_00
MMKLSALRKRARLGDVLEHGGELLARLGDVLGHGGELLDGLLASASRRARRELQVLLDNVEAEADRLEAEGSVGGRSAGFA